MFLLLNKPNVGLPETLNPVVDKKITLTSYVIVKHCCSLSEIVETFSCHKNNVKHVCSFT